ncbi:MAG TPA: MmcQ/YjbR family DNA-binding protein [Verrucomicrobiae bacterium]|nr:MmcQ/YjbR family DNA-binding protein [Verrucomicrobiae bacterium]
MGVTQAEFRRMALNHPDAAESSHMDHPDFRVRGRVFATLGYPDKEHGMVKLPPGKQAEFVRNSPNAFSPAKGAWGKRGSTTVLLRAVKKAELREALLAAWASTARKKR